ncbi:MAG: hypothetical protein FWF57_04765 [Defluviitaleaceae bacterium]|nr:hypothetical protein [Defluviitaleaceae bacterium]
MVNKKIYRIVIIVFSIFLLGCSAKTSQSNISYDTDFMNIELHNISSNIDIREIDFSNEYLFVDEYSNFVDYLILDERLEQLTTKDFFNGIFEILDFYDNYLYLLSSLPVINNNRTGITYYDTLARINIDKKYIEIDLSYTEGVFFDNTQFGYNLILENLENRAIFRFVESGILEDGIRSTFFRKTFPIYGEDIDLINRLTTGRIFEIFSPRFPFVYHSNDYSIIIYIQDNTYILGYILNSNNMFNEILRYEITNHENDLQTGMFPIYAFGNSYGIYFQIVTLENGFLDFDGKSSLYFYSFETNTYEEILRLKDNIVHINKKNDILVFEYFGIDTPRELTGRVLFKNNETYFTIPKISPSNRIVESYIYDVYIYIISSEYLIHINTIDNSYSYVNFSHFDGYKITNVIISNNKFIFISDNKTNLSLTIFSFI